MSRIIIFSVLLVHAIAIFFACAPTTSDSVSPEEMEDKSAVEKPDYAIAIHGGAGSVNPKGMTPEMEKKYSDALNSALDIGETILKNGGTASDAVEKTITFLEDSPLFNAGKGSVLNTKGANDLDASFMDGATMNAGAVGGVTIVKNPIQAARAVMDLSEHVFLAGEGANQFAVLQGLDTVPNSYFHTEGSQKALDAVKAQEIKGTGFQDEDKDYKFGTVGCVAMDKNGDLAAGTSTGGMTNKKYNRIGDSPVIGAGTYAKNGAAAVSCTGHGEFFIRYVVAYDLIALLQYENKTLYEAANFIIHDKLMEVGGAGGLIALDQYGNISMPFNTNGMYRGYAKPGERLVRMYKDKYYQ